MRIKSYWREGYSSASQQAGTGATLCDSITETQMNVRSLALTGDSTGWESLPARQSLTKLWVGQIKPEQFQWLARLKRLRMLSLCSVPRVHDFSVLSELSELRCLVIWHAPKMTSLDFVTPLRSLESLYIRWADRLKEITPVAKLSALREFGLESGFHRPMRIKTFLPLGSLGKLEYLTLFLDTDDRSLKPIGHLTRLKELRIGMRFPMPEFARLAACLPRAKCGLLKRPWCMFSFPCKRCGMENTIILAGTRREILCRSCDADHLRAFQAEFRRIKDETMSGRM